MVLLERSLLGLQVRVGTQGRQQRGHQCQGDDELELEQKHRAISGLAFPVHGGAAAERDGSDQAGNDSVGQGGIGAADGNSHLV